MQTRQSSATGEAASCRLGGRSFSSDITSRAVARHHSRCVTRAMSSVLPPIARPYARALPGTVNRVKPSLTHRKQTIAHASTRNVPVHDSRAELFATDSPSLCLLSRARVFRISHPAHAPPVL